MKKAVSVPSVFRRAQTGTARSVQCPFLYDKQEQAGHMDCVQPALYYRVCC